MTRLQTQPTQAQIAADQWDRYKEMYSPLEDAYVKDAQSYGSTADYDRAAGDASATVSSQFGKARERLSRTPGLDPSSPAFTASMAGLDMAQAANDAVSQNAARKGVTDTAWAKKTDALSMGKGLPAQASSALASVGSNQMAMARYNQGLSDASSASIGRVVDRVFNSQNSGWLGNAPRASQSFPYSNNDVTIPMQPGGGY